MSNHGLYARRVHITPETIRLLIGLPEGCKVRSVHWHDDRQAFGIVVDMPEEPDWFVEATQIIPELPVTVILTTDSFGGKHLQVKIPVVEAVSGA